LELFGESYDRYFETDQGRIGVMADIYASGDVVELRDLVIYPEGPSGRLNVGPKAIRSIQRTVEAELRSMGYRELRITGDRLSGANPGKHVDRRRKL
jgi:hypothetical protein